jgi:glycosyltransferase involved in cell wall biosynthesis
MTARLLTSRDYWIVAREWLAQFTRKTELQDILAIEGYGFWWTLNGQKFVAGLTETGNAFAWLDLMEAVSQHFRCDRVVVHGQHNTIVHLAGQVFKETELCIHPGSASRKASMSRSPRHPGLLLVRLLLGIAYLFYSLFRRPEICLLSNTNLLRRTTAGSHERLRDVYLGDVAQALRARGWQVAVVEKYGPNASWAGLTARGLFFASDIIFALSTPILGRLGFHRRVMLKWRERWANVQPALAAHLHYRGYDLSPLLLPLVRNEFLAQAPDLEVMTGIWRRILTRWRPELLYVVDSYGRAAFTAIVAAKLLGIPTVEQQHGVIGRHHIAYLWPQDLEPISKRPLCDFMTVWGEHTKRLLSGVEVYEPERMIVCGFPGVDTQFKELPSRSTARARLGIPSDAPLVLYTSNGFAQDLIREILDGIQRVPDSSNIIWIVKLHPREKTGHLWNAAIAERKLHTVQVLGGEQEFYTLLAACDLHASFASTTVLEAAILGIPNLGLDTPRVPDPIGYAEAGAFLPVAPDQLGPVALLVLQDPEQRAMLLDEQLHFANEWCMHDGQAVSRIVAFVESTVSSMKSEYSYDAAI